MRGYHVGESVVMGSEEELMEPVSTGRVKVQVGGGITNKIFDYQYQFMNYSDQCIYETHIWANNL